MVSVALAVLPPLTLAPVMTWPTLPPARIWPVPVTFARRLKVLPVPALALV